MALPIRTRPSFPFSLCYQEGSIRLLSFSIGGRQTESHNHRKLTNLITWNTALSNSMKLWAMPRRATQDARLMVENSDKSWSTGDVNGKPLQNSCLENPMNSMKRQKDRTLKDELPRFVGAQYATGDQWRNKSRKNEEMELFLHWSLGAYWAPTHLGCSSFSVLFFCLSHCSWGSQGKNAEMVYHSLLQWTTFLSELPPWPHMAWLIVSLS